ncbi:MAG TPA: hypothetical protein VFR68_15810 [Candidatus Dormibacteraeota bacterium]|nr:hypothetical protein [Candidatus Dormibacteraeota bacterium]
MAAATGTLVLVSIAVALALQSGPTVGDCQPVFPTANAPHVLDLAYLKARNYQAAGTIDIGSDVVNSHFQSGDSRNFAVQVSVAEYSAAFGLPATDAQNIFYGSDPARRVILVFSYGSFVWHFSGDTAAGGGVSDKDFHVAMAALDAKTGDLINDQVPTCK